MADLRQHKNYSGEYSGLLDNLYVTAAISAACLIGYEIEVHIPRRRGRDGTFKRIPVRLFHAGTKAWLEWRGGEKSRKETEGRESSEGLMREKQGEESKIAEARRRLGSREAWEFAYIFQPKAWRLNPSPPVPRWPLAWIFAGLKVREKDMPETCGLDITLHARFLRGAFFYTLMQAIIVLPILLPLHVLYSPASVSRTSMLKASVSSLVESSGSRWLWVHSVLIWWVAITWTATVLWITWGGVAYRRREIRRLAERVRRSREAKDRTARGENGISEGEADAWTVGEDCEGIKRFLRDEQTLRDYFDYYLHRYRARYSNMPMPKETPRVSKEGARLPMSPAASHHSLYRIRNLLKTYSEPKSKGIAQPVLQINGKQNGDDEDNRTDDGGTIIGDNSESEVDEVILVRKLAALSSLRARRETVLRQLEVAHVKLARRVLEAVRRHQAKDTTASSSNNIPHPVHDVEKGVTGVNAARDETLPDGMSKVERLDRLSQAISSFVDDEAEERGRSEETVWDILHALPRELLDPYQSLTHLTSLFRDQNAPLIDYLTTKLSYLTMLLDESRSQPLSHYPPASTAFVTFKDAQTARLALRVLDNHPKRSLACHTMAAPDWTNLIWPRLGKSVYRSGFVRGWVVFVGVWAFTLVWIFPVSLLCALTSLTNIAGFIKPLQRFLDQHPKASAAISSLAPVILVALLTLCICPILLLIANKAETVNTRLGVHNSVLERFWKFLMVNGVVFFAVGQTAIEAYLTAFQTNDFSPLPIVASAFPTAAPYFASYILLQVAIQPFFEVFRFGLPTIVYVFGTRVSTVPRQRHSRTAYPTFSHFSQVPQQLLAGAIMHLFMLLNPLVIPFTLIFYGACYVVWKRQFTFVYGRLYENNGRRTSIRVLRYSLDALALGQFVLFAFFILNKAKGHAISTGVLFFLTLIAKLVITGALKKRFDSLDIEEADLLCPPVPRNQDDTDHQSRLSIDDHPAEDEPNKQISPSASASGLAVVRSSLSSLASQWLYAVGPSRLSGPQGYRSPIPFDSTVFATLDSKISFDSELDGTKSTTNSTALIPTSETDAELQHEPDHPITHPIANRVVVAHHPLRPWEDIPPYQRSRGYNDQPAYTDDYDDFLWLPRDPLSTLDLDDTVEMRLSLTTSAGGSGAIGDWPPVSDHMSETVIPEHEHEHWQEVIIHHSAASPEQIEQVSPGGNSQRRLIERIDLPEHIGSEVEEGLGSGLLRRTTRKASEGFSQIFGRPRSATNQSDAFISMRTLSISSGSTQERNHSPAVPPAVPGRMPSDPSFLTPARKTTPQSAPVPIPQQFNIESSPQPRSGSQITFPPQIGRSDSNRRPSAMRLTSQNSDSGLRSPGRIRSSAALSPARSMTRDRSASAITAAQQALMEEVMEEERRAAKAARKGDKEDRHKEGDEVIKEQERLRRMSIGVEHPQRSASGTERNISGGRERSRSGGGRAEVLADPTVTGQDSPRG